ncbi:PIG-L family deacetylase [Aspergillus tanneri]|uniref:N-acetylglucosaminylphosphatidylinositol deacetylase n=1 Tax=Aspergillus tanneri TaxID=1220188 RepID=A0A5M9ND60_9EURO|nr:N-acetylglucosaminyl-phosphatidylinositol de-N-acetylase [Aspergillus tanneri]KAA8652597.1 N-acetylglucosaminyl-phosphatidylinositol de-N-acetylase [Aspergillus tanneri]
MTPSTLLSIGIAIAAVFIFWTLSSTSSSPFAHNFPRLYNQRICLLIAHPDDEAMFFAPTVLALTKPELGNHLKILCLSSGTSTPKPTVHVSRKLTEVVSAMAGDADGLGHIRKKELQKSAMQLGLRNESDVFVVDDPSRFPDSMATTWSANEISSLLAAAFAPEIKTTGRESKTNRSPTIDVILTFDQHGVSNHPNHRSLYHGARHFLHSLMKDKAGYSCPVSLYTLTTTNILRKYVGVLDAPLTMARGALASVFSTVSLVRRSRESGPPSRLLFVSSVTDWMTAQSAMVTAHKSQMVWFRWGWITFGRYMAVNDLDRERI